ncbi:hypothetical protein BDV95DRAFT_68687 [Massariosphaeria phaeospora]|uniref:Zn(2)-C6 fungal-type domain-containing protein n=1 Tax=Massariosphaeria phaeospora TaxID=100035 RepID=A0A7C8MDR7_9PLEO|nr:hypothetical protein BDV95DRAFT_68687 [Massariosphaeria phaeospora]
MNQASKSEPTSNLPTQGSPYKHNPYARMSSRRAIACTICAKAKTKCDKAVPSCSRCTAKGLQCEPRSTRRTSDSNYRNPKRHIVSPKRFPTAANSVPGLSRHSSPRSIPSSDRHQLVRAVTHMDIHHAAKMGHPHANFTGFNMLTPLQTYSPQIIEDCYSTYSSSPEQHMTAFSHPMETKNNYITSGRLTPQTPEPFSYHEPLPIMDSFEYMHPTTWSEDGHTPIGLGFESDIPGMMPSDMWTTPEPEGSATPMGHMRAYESPAGDSPASMNVWQQPSLSASPPLEVQRGVPSLSVSECSTQDFESPNIVQNEWQNYRPNPNHMVMGKSNTSTIYYDDVKTIQKSGQWEDVLISRSSTF